MRTIMKLALVSAFLGTNTICCKHNSELHYYIKIVNESSKDIFFTDGLNYPDTSINPYNITQDGKHYRANSYSTVKFYANPDTWESNIGSNDEEGLMIFILDAKMLDSVPWDSVVKNYLILERFSLTLKCLDSLNWTIIHK